MLTHVGGSHSFYSAISLLLTDILIFAVLLYCVQGFYDIFVPICWCKCAKVYK